VTTTTEVRTLLDGTSLPPELVDDLLDGASATWLMGERADVVAADLVLCHPRLALAEVRAQVFPTTDGAWRLAVATRDRPGLLAAIAGVLATHGLSISTGSGTAWPDHDVALMRVTAHLRDDSGLTGDDDVDWDAIGDDLRSAIAEGRRVATPFVHVPEAIVEVMADGDRTLVTITCPDRRGLLWAVTSWFEGHDCNIDEAQVESDGDKAVGHFVVTGPVDAAALTTSLTGAPAEPFLLTSGRWLVRGVALSVGVTWGLVRALRRRAVG
jgi:predicted amino acid-binding ACT domain protein